MNKILCMEIMLVLNFLSVQCTAAPISTKFGCIVDQMPRAFTIQQKHERMEMFSRRSVHFPKQKIGHISVYSPSLTTTLLFTDELGTLCAQSSEAYVTNSMSIELSAASIKKNSQQLSVTFTPKLLIGNHINLEFLSVAHVRHPRVYTIYYGDKIVAISNDFDSVSSDMLIFYDVRHLNIKNALSRKHYYPIEAKEFAVFTKSQKTKKNGKLVWNASFDTHGIVDEIGGIDILCTFIVSAISFGTW